MTASDECLAIRRRSEASIDICRKSKGHTYSIDPLFREHYDPASEQRWTDDEEI